MSRNSNVNFTQGTYNVAEDHLKKLRKKGTVDMNDYAGYRHPQHRQVQRRTSGSDSISPLPSNYAVAMLYVPMQTDTTMFDEMKAFECGTLFTVLNKPFAGKCCQ